MFDDVHEIKGPPHDNKKSEDLDFVFLLENPLSLEFEPNLCDTSPSSWNNSKNSPLRLKVDSIKNQ